MLALVMAAYLAGAPAHKAKVAAPPAPPPPPADVWLDCKWHETWQSSSSLGAAHRESTSEYDYEKTYVFSPSKGTFSFYDPKYKYLLIQNATIGASAILVEDVLNTGNMLGESKYEHQLTVSRSDLSVKELGGSLTNIRMDDGRISTSQILSNGSGACTMIEPQPLEQAAPNKF